MQRAILCEGKTDAILASYMLGKLHGWGFNNQLTRKPKVTLPVVHENECLTWYSRNGVDLAIWGVGGYTELPTKMKAVADRTRAEGNAQLRFSHLVVVCDRDTRTEDECIANVSRWLMDAGITLNAALQLGQWLDGKVALARTPPADHDVKVLMVVVPPNSPGELESFLLTALSDDNDGDKELVDKAKTFIDGVPDPPYLVKRRLRAKAWLGAVLSVMSPDWVFSELDNRMKQVKWEDLALVCQVWGLLNQL